MTFLRCRLRSFSRISLCWILPSGCPLSPGRAGQEFFFESTLEVNDPTLTYTWDFGDGTTATGKSVTHTFTKSSSDYQVVRNVLLTVTDANGASNTAGRTVVISDLNNTFGKPFQDFFGSPGNYSVSKKRGLRHRWDRRTDKTVNYDTMINRAVESGTQVSGLGQFDAGGYVVANVNDGRYDTRWLFVGDKVQGTTEPKTNWAHFTFQNDGVLKPYRITEFSMVMTPLSWTWDSSVKEVDIYGSNVASPAIPTTTELNASTSHADWTLVHEERDPRLDLTDLSTGANSAGGNLVGTGFPLRYQFENPNAYAHYLFVIRNQGPNVGDYRVEVNEIELFDSLDYSQAGNTAPSVSFTVRSTDSGAAVYGHI